MRYRFILDFSLATHDRIMDAISRAHLVGTFNQVDRSKQYEDPTNHELLKSLNEAWSKIRVCEKSILAKDARIAQLESRVSRYKVVNMALTSILTYLAFEGVKFIAAYVLHLQ